jgi:hypothetical protein
MKILRNNFLKNTFGFVLLCIVLTKVFEFSISCFSAKDTFAIEKSAEESKDKEEDSFDKNKKKALLYELPVPVYQCLIWTGTVKYNLNAYRIPIGTHPIKSVPTPPPDSLS